MIAALKRGNRRFFAPEVVQTSAMDCGPASLKCLLEGFGAPVSYGRLREACQTDVDGTSIDTLEEVACQLELDAEQIVLPIDHVLLSASQTLPAIVVVCLPNGLTHFVVVWRRHGPWVQVMDPGTGRRWTTVRQFLSELYVHPLQVAAAEWREWAGSDDFLHPLQQRLNNLGITDANAQQIVRMALADPDWHPLAALDAATRLTDSLVRSGGLRRGREASQALEAFFEQARQISPDDDNPIPKPYWSVQFMANASDEKPQVTFHGAVLVKVRGPRPVAPSSSPSKATSETATLSPELIAALEESPSHPGYELLRLLRADGLLAPLTLLTTMALAAGTIVIQALLLWGLLELGLTLTLPEQRLIVMVAIILFAVISLLLQLYISSNVLHLGRHLEARLRIAFLEKIPRLGDRYFQSRLISDMAERSHNVYRLRLLPVIGADLLRSFFTLMLTIVGLIWLNPPGAIIAVLSGVLAVVVPLLAHPALAEQDLRVRSHLGALSRFYLDALLGLVTIHTHRAEPAVRREHDNLLVEWGQTSLTFYRTVVMVEGVQLLLGFGLAIWLLFAYLTQDGTTGAILLLVFWALNLPVLGQDLALAIRQYPTQRNITLRLLEPLGAPEPIEEQDERQPAASVNMTKGVDIALENISVQAAGHSILTNINLSVARGSHIAIVGASGAGKSSLVGLLMGWHRPATGQILIDGRPLNQQRLEQLRRHTAWVDPAVQLWNRSFLDNLHYGTPNDCHQAVNMVIDQADLHRILETLPDGLQTSLGEGGGLVSGGEGQRVRLGRAMMRPNVRLVILDEPFRGLDRSQRCLLLQRVRQLWPHATLFCITHDIEETQKFDRVLVIETGQIIEDEAPTRLAQQRQSRYATLLAAEKAVREGLWSNGIWRRFWVGDGQVAEKQDREGEV